MKERKLASVQLIELRRKTLNLGVVSEQDIVFDSGFGVSFFHVFQNMGMYGV